MSRNIFAASVFSFAACLGATPAEPASLCTQEFGPASAGDLESLMRRFSKMPGLFARFEETKHIELLVIPLVNKGTLNFDGHDRMLRRVTDPESSVVLLLKDSLWFGNERALKRIELGSNPAVRTFVGSFRALLKGDLALLRSQYEMRLEVTAGGTEAIGAQERRWRLELVPRTKGLRKILSSLKISGRGLVLERLTVNEASGDVGETRFFDVDPRRSYSEDESRRLFRTQY